MSECVVRMEMPEDCFECPFGIMDDTEDGVWCNALAQQSNGQRDDCPIVCALPENHGRLVDADTVVFATPNDSMGEVPPMLVTVDDLIESYDVPTIVPAERREE